jgi:3-mercaptopyruvate sulfurtransferase SseA
MRKSWLFIPLLVLLLVSCSALQPTQPAQVIGEPQIPESEVPRVSLEEALTAYQDGSAVFVDVRAASSYEASHIPGALSLPVAEIETRFNELDPNHWIITYCT